MPANNKSLQEICGKSVVLIGEEQTHKIAWIQYFSSDPDIPENELRQLMIDISLQIKKRRQKPESARKFKEGKLLFYKVFHPDYKNPKIYSLFSYDGTINSLVKKAMKLVSERGGYYSASRFFQEVDELVQHPEKIKEESQLNLEDAIHLLFQSDIQKFDVNFIGQILSIVRKGGNLDSETLERVYFLAYEILSNLSDMETIDTDIDLALDGVYDVAKSYQERETFHLALELYKRLLPLVQLNGREELDVLCRIHISEIYHKYFPESGSAILEVLDPKKIVGPLLQKVPPSIRQKYFILLANSYEQLDDLKMAEKFYYSALKDAENDLGDPYWVAKGYEFFARKARNQFLYDEAFKQYLTASSLAFSAGDIVLSNNLRCEAGFDQVKFSFVEIVTSLFHRMENDLEKSIYLAWDSLKMLLEGYSNILTNQRHNVIKESNDILTYASSILSIPGKKRKNLSLINKIRKIIRDTQLQMIDENSEKEHFHKLFELILRNIPISPPTFLLISSDGRLITSGIITKEGWSNPNLEGVVFSGILSAIMGLLSEVSPSSATLRTIDAGGMKIMVEKNEEAIAVILADRETREFRIALRNILEQIKEKFSIELDMWDGNLSFVPEIIDIVINDLVHIF